MKRDLLHENFEEFLQGSADDLRMKAPDRVWKNISRELNKRRRRFIILLCSFLLTSSTIAYFTITTHYKQIVAHNITPTQRLIIDPLSNPSIVSKSLADGEMPHKPLIVLQQPKQALFPRGFKSTPNKKKAIESFVENLNGSINDPVRQKEIIAFTPLATDSYTEFDPHQNSLSENQHEEINKNEDAFQNETLPLTIESVLNSSVLQHRKKRMEAEFHLSPTISYRKLSENKSYLRDAGPSTNYNALYNSVNSMVTHKPDIGFEVGITAKYPLSNNVKLLTGFQFNVNRYDIRAYNSYFEVATISLNSNTRADSLNTLSSYSNVKGYKSDWLQNFSFQVSVPVGIEINFKGTDKVQFGMASTIQPTYILGDKAYLITTDYKNYTQVPWLTRRWNVNTSLETFVSYRAGKIKWQIGPQVRYQLLSSFVSKYPVKENLFDFGLKVGLTINK